MPKTCVIGIGNVLMGDDGVGVRVAEELASRDLGADASVVVGGLGGMQLTPHLLENEKVIFIDAIDAGDEPGSIFRFRAEDGVPMMRSHTSHGISIPNLLLGSRLSGSQAEVIVYAIQVGYVSPSAEGMSDPVATAGKRVLEMVAAEVTQGTLPELVHRGATEIAESER